MKSIRIIVLSMILTLSCLAIPISTVFASDSVANDALESRQAMLIQPHWTNTESISSSLTFSGTTANCGARIVGMSGTTRISATFTLQRRVNGTWVTIKTWTESSSSNTLNFSGTHTVTKGFTYRLSVNATVTRNGVSETVSSWSENTL